MRRAVFVAGLAALSGMAVVARAQVSIPEIEPNESKAQATVAVLRPGDSVTGITTGMFGNTPSPANWDFFRIRTDGLAPGRIYRHRLVLSSLTPGHNGALAGRTQANGVIQTASSVLVQLSSSFTSPAHFNQWYGFGLGEEVYYLVRGGTTTTEPYFATLVSDPITPTTIGPFEPGSIVIFTTPGPGVNTELFLYDDAFSPLAMNDDISSVNPINRASRLQLNLDPGVYYLAVGCYNMANDQPSSGNFEFRNGLVLDFPNALFAESSGTGQTVSFTVTDAAGSSSFPAIQTEPYQALWYRVEVGTSCEPAAIASSPAGTEVCVGDPVLFQVVASGSAPLSYQWRFNGLEIPGATGDSLAIAAASFAHAGVYDVVVSNACGTVVSDPATLVVHPDAPVITSDPQSLTLCIGETAVFSVAAHGHMGVGLEYQWLKDGEAIPGANASVYSFTVSSLADGGQYACMVSEPGCGTSTSLPAMLTVRNEPPVIVLNGSPALVLECGIERYVERGAVALDDCDGMVPVIIGGEKVNDRKPGLYTVRYTAMDSQGNAAQEVTRAVYVRDTMRPRVCAGVCLQVLWPPNNQMKRVGLTASAIDAGDPKAGKTLEIRVFSNEPERAKNNGKVHAPDASDLAPGRLRLRAERDPKGSGRVYLIVASAVDQSGNRGFAFASVLCPRDLSLSSLKAVCLTAARAHHAAAEAAKDANDVESAVRPLLEWGWTEVGVPQDKDRGRKR